MHGEDRALVVQTTAGSFEEASLLASSLVGRRLAACVQIVPGVESVYWWEGAVTRSAEWLLVCKTTLARYTEVERTILELHSYTTPEVIAVPIELGAADYLAWLSREVGPDR